MATRFQQRRDTSANWTAKNPVLADGEFGIEKDTGIVKFGNGVSTWNQLSPILGSQYLPLLGKAYDSERLDGLDSTAFAQKNYVDDRILAAGAARSLVTHFGSATAYPATGFRIGDRVWRSDLYCTMSYNGAGWKQDEVAICTKTQRLSIATASLYAGFMCWESDTTNRYEWTGVFWRALTGLPKFFAYLNSNTRALGGSGAVWDVPFDTVSEDTHNAFDTTGQVNYVIPVTGRYEISANVGFNPSGTGIRFSQIAHSILQAAFAARTSSGNGVQAASSGPSSAPTVPYNRVYMKNDIIKVQAAQTTGGNLNFLGNASGNAAQSCGFSIVCLEQTA